MLESVCESVKTCHPQSVTSIQIKASERSMSVQRHGIHGKKISH